MREILHKLVFVPVHDIRWVRRPLQPDLDPDRKTKLCPTWVSSHYLFFFIITKILTIFSLKLCRHDFNKTFTHTTSFIFLDIFFLLQTQHIFVQPWRQSPVAPRSAIFQPGKLRPYLTNFTYGLKIIQQEKPFCCENQ